MIVAILYRHIRLDNNTPFYIGIGKDLKRAFTKFGRNDYWKKIIGKTDYKVDILFDDLNWESACEKEKEFIQLYGRFDLGLGTLCNMTDGGDGVVNYKISDETKERIRKTLTGRKHTDSTKKKMSDCKLGNKHFFYGKQHSDVSKNKISQSKTGFNHTQNSKEKISQTMIINEIGYPIIQLSLTGEFLNEFDSIHNIDIFDLDKNTISAIRKNILGYQKSARGFIWKKKDSNQDGEL